ncbi:hypothetical protein D6C93_10471 [Aureobasidium pullulans]|nr:hypothetical protein D6C93_10471 [Aureobasidium pullulans]
MPPKPTQYSDSPMLTPPPSPDEEEEDAIFNASEEENNNNITSALEDEDNEDEDIEDDNNENSDNDESNEDDNNNANLQESFQTRITTLTQTLNRLTARTLAIRYQRLHYETNLTASLSNQDTQGENTQQTQLAVLRLREKIIKREIGEVKAQMQALRAEIDAAVQSSDDDNDNDNDDGDEIMEEDEEMQECNHEQNLDDGDGAATKEIVEVDEDWLLLDNVNDNDDMEDDVMEKSETEEYDMMEDEN